MGSLFEEVAGIGRGFLNSTHGGPKVLQDYTYMLSQFCELLNHTHSMVLQKLECIEDAKTLNEAQVACRELQGEALSGAFRSCGLCDVFRGYGSSLRRLLPQSRPGGRSSVLLFLGGGQVRWEFLCDALEEKEARVANLYVDQIQEIHQLISDRSIAEDLPKMNELARQAKTKLTQQMADFEALAQGFRSHLKK
jgi:hypothetical protein